MREPVLAERPAEVPSVESTEVSDAVALHQSPVEDTSTEVVASLETPALLPNLPHTAPCCKTRPVCCKTSDKIVSQGFVG